MTHPTKDHKNEPLWDFRNVTVDHKGEANFFSISSCQPTQICARGLGAREQGVVLAMSCISSCPPILLDFVTGSIMSYTRRRTESAWGQAESALCMQMTPTFAHVGALRRVRLVNVQLSRQRAFVHQDSSRDNGRRFSSSSSERYASLVGSSVDSATKARTALSSSPPA